MLIDLRERFNDFEEVLRLAVEGILKGRRTASVVQITQDSSDGHTTVAQPTIKNRVQDIDGNVTYEALNPHPDVPIHYPSGGGHSFTHPVKSSGDTGLVVYADRAIDDWHAEGGLQQPVDGREHSLSDAVYIPGVRSDANKLASVSTVSAQQRSDNGDHFTDVHKDNGVTHQSKNMVLGMVGDNASHVLTSGGFKANATKICLNC